MNRPSSITFSRIEKKSMEKDHQAYLHFSFALIKTWKGVKRRGGSNLIYGIHPLSHPWTWNLLVSMSYSWVIHFLWVIPTIWVIVLSRLVTLPVTCGEFFGHHYTIFVVLIKSMLPSQFICDAYMFKGCQLVSTIFNLFDHSSRPSLCQLCSAYLISSHHLLESISCWLIMGTSTHYLGSRSRNQ